MQLWPKPGVMGASGAGEVGREGRFRSQRLRLGLGSVDAGCLGHFLLQVGASSPGESTTLLRPHQEAIGVSKSPKHSSLSRLVGASFRTNQDDSTEVGTCSPVPLGQGWGMGGDEPLCLQAPVPPFIWGWAVLGLPPPGSSHPPSAWKRACG